MGTETNESRQSALFVLQSFRNTLPEDIYEKIVNVLHDVFSIQKEESSLKSHALQSASLIKDYPGCTFIFLNHVNTYSAKEVSESMSHFQILEFEKLLNEIT